MRRYLPAIIQKTSSISYPASFTRENFYLLVLCLPEIPRLNHKQKSAAVPISDMAGLSALDTDEPYTIIREKRKGAGVSLSQSPPSSPFLCGFKMPIGQMIQFFYRHFIRVTLAEDSTNKVNISFGGIAEVYYGQ